MHITAVALSEQLAETGAPSAVDVQIEKEWAAGAGYCKEDRHGDCVRY